MSDLSKSRWALVMRDWSRGLLLGCYSIHQLQFNTRMPLHINDDDLSLSSVEAEETDRITERPRSEFTHLSYTIYALEIASLARESVDLRDSPCQAKAQTIYEWMPPCEAFLTKSTRTFLLRCRLNSVWEVAQDSTPQQLPWQRYQYTNGCCINRFGACS